MTKRADKGHAAPGTAGADTEIELKLLCDPAQLERVGSMQALLSHAVGPECTDALAAIYYDTEELDLRQLGLSLRVRAEGLAFIMTAKSTDSGNLLQRGEKKVPVADMEPDASGLREILDGPVLARIADKPLRPVFTTKVQRRVRVLQHPLGKVELAIDHGHISAGTHREEVSEVELELLHGQPLALWTLAQDMLEEGDFRPSLQTKSDRGFALFLTGQPPTPVTKDRPPPFGGACAEALQQALAWQVRRLIQLQPQAASGVDSEAVHQYRIALRRLLTLFRIIQTIAPAQALKPLMAQAKGLLRQLGPVRAWDVFLQETLAEAASVSGEPKLFDTMREAAEERRLEAQAQARAALEHPSTASFLIHTGLWTESGGWRQDLLPAFASVTTEPLATFSRELLQLQYRRVRRRGKGFARQDAAQRHRVRLAAKTLKYALEFLGDELGSKRRSRHFLDRLSRLQTHLGRLSDTASTKALLAELLALDRGADMAEVAGFIAGMQASGRARLDRRLARSWKRFRAAARPW